MNNNDEMLKALRSLYVRTIFESNIKNLASSMNDNMQRSYRELEHHPSIQTDITDKDMLLIRIDMALDAGDSELFMHLTNELKGMEVLV